VVTLLADLVLPLLPLLPLLLQEEVHQIRFSQMLTNLSKVVILLRMRGRKR